MCGALATWRLSRPAMVSCRRCVCCASPSHSSSAANRAARRPTPCGRDSRETPIRACRDRVPPMTVILSSPLRGRRPVEATWRTYSSRRPLSGAPGHLPSAADSLAAVRLASGRRCLAIGAGSFRANPSRLGTCRAECLAWLVCRAVRLALSLASSIRLASTIRAASSPAAASWVPCSAAAREYPPNWRGSRCLAKAGRRRWAAARYPSKGSCPWVTHLLRSAKRMFRQSRSAIRSTLFRNDQTGSAGHN